MVTDADTLKIATQTVLRDIAKHANALAMGLQNAAPPQETAPNKSVQYLMEVAVALEEVSKSVDE